MTVLIIFSFDEAKAPVKKTGFSQTQEEPRLYGRPEIEAVNVNVDVGEKSDKMSEDESSSGTNSSDNETLFSATGKTQEMVTLCHIAMIKTWKHGLHQKMRIQALTHLLPSQ
ncbi:hypothetical protein PMIN06_006597 [Paraphaeosphaeria minitans]